MLYIVYEYLYIAVLNPILLKGLPLFLITQMICGSLLPEKIIAQIHEHIIKIFAQLQ